MNFLQLCQRTATECGIAGSVASVTNQTGMNGKIVNWVLAAHQEIQEKHTTWRFDWQSTTKALTNAQESYTPSSDWSLSVRSFDAESFYIYQTSLGAATRTPMCWKEWKTYRDIRVPGSSGAPSFVCEAPDGTVKFYPIPTAGYTVAFDYYRSPETLAAAGDTPRMPSEYHMAIVWRAVMFYAGHDEASNLYQVARANFDRIMSRMEDTELDAFEESEPLA